MRLISFREPVLYRLFCCICVVDASAARSLGGGGDEFGGGVVGGVEEIGGAQVGEEHGVEGRVAEVFAHDGVHRDGEARGYERAVVHLDFAACEAHGAVVVVEEIAAGPANEALRGIDAVGAVGNGGLGEIAGALERAAGGCPFIEPAAEYLNGGVAGVAELLGGGLGIERAGACAVNDEGGGGVEREGGDVVGKGGLVHAGVVGAWDAAGGKDLGGQDVEQHGRVCRPQQRLEFLGFHWGTVTME